MTDREKIIKGLECCKWSRQNINPEKVMCNECPYKDKTIMNAYTVWQSCTNILAGEALALLKEQEAVEPKRIDGKRNHFIKCGNCNYDLLTGYLFCPHCGRKVNWE